MNKLNRTRAGGDTGGFTDKKKDSMHASEMEEAEEEVAELPREGLGYPVP